jgi:hypothetical protein
MKPTNFISMIMTIGISQALAGCLAGENQQFFGAGTASSLATGGSGLLSVSSPTNGLVGASPSPTPDPSTIVCDPLSPGNQTDATLGIETSLYYIENYVVGGAYPVTTCDAFLTQGVKANVDVFLSDLNTPPENFSAGFQTSAGNFVEKADGSVLDEWFSLQGTSQIQLGTADRDGYYQFATISDDGVTFKLQNPDGTWNTLIDHQYPHSAMLDCAAAPVYLVKGQKIPMQFQYYQGPRYRIAMMLLWREVDQSMLPATADCGNAVGDDYFFNGTVSPSVPLVPYTNLLAEGWKPLTNQNFLLKDATNQCVQ